MGVLAKLAVKCSVFIGDMTSTGCMRSFRLVLSWRGYMSYWLPKTN